MLHVAFAGTGSIVRGRHAPEALRESRVTIAGFYGTNPQQAKEFSGLFGGRLYASYEELLDDPMVDAVVIATPNYSHAEMSIAALKKGKHVLCEKPLATSATDAKAMLEAAETENRILMAAHNLHLEPAFELAKKHLDSGLLGKVLTFHACIGSEGPSRGVPVPWFFKSSKAGHGVSSDIAIHMFETLIHLFEEPIVKVKALTSVRYHHKPDGTPIEVEDTGATAIETASGIIGTVLFSWCLMDRWQSTLTIYCEKGVIRVYPEPDTMLALHFADGRVEKTPTVPKNEWPHGSGMMRAFVQAIEEQVAPTQYATNGMLAVQTVDAIFAGSEE